MMIRWYDESVRLTGRWSRIKRGKKDASRFVQAPTACTVTTAPGSWFEAAFTGTWAVLHFDLGYLVQPYPHLWISVDGGARMEVPVDRHVRIETEAPGNHVVKVIYKGGMEMLSRWYAPLAGSVAFYGLEAEGAGVLSADDRKLIEFVGDSITEGVLIDADYTKRMESRIDQQNRVYQDDNCATYAALTAQALDLRPMFQAYGAVGLTRSGCGGVPRCGLLYPWVFDGVPYTGEKPDIVVINHGANDRDATAEEYLMRYGELLDMVRNRNPRAVIVCLGAFCGAFDEELGPFVAAYNENNDANVHFISSKGWVPPEPLHPLRDGHRIIAEKLTAELKKIL